jgi:hypothetical protein
MITRIVMHDDEEGECEYRRTRSDPFAWELVIGEAVSDGHDGRDVLWQVSLAVHQGLPS